MITLGKNKEIALMLGYSKVKKVNTFYIDEGLPCYDEMRDLSVNLGSYSFNTGTSKNLHWLQFKHLCFHSDANWQFEAIKFIENINPNNRWWININYHECCIYDNNFKHTAEGVSRTTTASSTKEAIFEALFQFSQYLKTVK